MNRLLQDLRYGVRTMVKTPAFTIVAVLSIALGIAVNTSVFTLVNGMLFKPMPVRNPEHLVALYTTEPNEPYPDSFSYPEYLDYRDHNQVFSDLFIHYTTPLSLNQQDGLAEMVSGELVTGNYFTGLRLDAALGRLLTPDDDRRPGGHPVTVLSHAFWQRRFGGDPTVVGRVVKLNGHDFTIVGVAKKGFSGTRQFGWIPDVYLPLMMHAQAIPGTTERFLNSRGNRSFNVNGRLKDGVSIAQAQAAMDAFARQLANDYPQTNANLGVGILPGGTKTQPAIAKMGYLEVMTSAMMGLVVLVLLVACANVANLLLARATIRRREIAMRLALGATRSRLIRQLLTESVLLSACGGGFGLLLAVWLNGLFGMAAPQLDFETIDLAYDLGLDYRILGFTAVLSVMTGVIFGLLPALQASRPDLMTILKGEAGGAAAGLRRFSLRNLLVVSQIALSLVLLISAGLLIKSMQNAQTMNPGFRTDRILMGSTNLDLHNYDEARGRSFYKQLGERLKGLPGVENASFAGPLPLDQYTNGSQFMVEGRVPKTENERLQTLFSIVAHDYFETMDTAILQGRAFTEHDNERAPRVVIINQAMARHYWPNENPLGRRLRLGNEQNPWLEVIGVAQDGKYITLGEPPTDYMFLPFWQNYDGRMTMVVRTTGNPETLSASIREEVKRLDEQLPVYGVRTASGYLDRVLSTPEAIAALVSIFGLLALTLAAVGLYGVMGYVVAHRSKEIGIRMAMGADAGKIQRMVLRQGMTLAVIGLAAGTAISLALASLMANLLYSVSAADPATFAIVALVLASAALLACYIPARRAMKVDPMVALRHE